MIRNMLIAAAALSALAVGSAGTASAGYYSHHNYYQPHYQTYYKPHHNYYKPRHHYVKKHYNYDYNEGYNDGYYVQNDCGWKTVQVVRWNHGYRYVDFIRTWTCSGY